MKARQLPLSDYAEMLNNAGIIEDNIVVAYGKTLVEVIYVDEESTVLALREMSDYVANMICEGVETTFISAVVYDSPLDERKATQLATEMLYDYADEQLRIADTH